MSASPPGTRSGTLTILFTDLVGSTTLRAQLGEERAEVARREHHRLLGEAIAAHQGTLHDDLGDGIMASFAGAADAVAAAVAIQQAATSGGGRRDDEAVASIRVGISAGDVAWEQGHPHGMPLVEASRLCGVAEGGQILVAEIVRVLVRGRGGHTFTSVGQIALKGLPGPVAACAVAWEPLGLAAGIPFPARLGTRAAFAMFGRSGEEEILTRAWEKARDGERQLVLIAGEPGIGKTRLAVEAARAAHTEGATVLFGGCDEDVGLPYRPFVEALRHYVVHASTKALNAHVQVHRGEFTRLVPELARRVADVPAPQVAEAETERFLLFEAVTGLLAAASRESPLVLVLDDLQWAGAPELLLLKHLIRSAEPMRLLVIVTYRDTDLAPTHALTMLLADLRRETGIERVALDGLDETAVEALVTAVARHELDPALTALARAIRQETEGNPFFIGEVIRHLSESGALFQEHGHWTYRGEITDLGIPEGVRDVVGRRLARLSATTRRVLGLAAVIGRHFDVALLVGIAEASEDAVLDALDEATAAALVAEVRGSPGQFAFRHALIRSTLYEEQSATRRVGLHRHVGEALEALVQATPGARVEELAYHWLAASRTDSVAKAIGYARQAGERALANLAFEEAAAHFARALGVLEPRDPDGERLRCDLLLAMGDAQRRAGDARYRETVAKAAAAARALGDGERLALAALTNARLGGYMASVSAVDEGLIALYDEAAGALGDADSLLRARLLGQLAVELVYTPQRERRDALTAEAVAIARRLGDRTGLAQVLIQRLIAMSDPFTLAERLALTGELTALAGALGSTELAWHAAVHRTGALLESGDIGGAEGALVEGERRAGELRQLAATWWARTGRTMLAVMRGAPDAEAQVFATFELGTAGGQPDAAVVFGGQLNTLRHNQGRAGELAEVMRANVDAMPHLPAWRSALARLYSETDQLEQAREQVDILRASGIDPPLDWSWPGYMITLSEAVRDLNDRAAAAVLYERLRPVARQVYVLAGMITCGGSYGLYAGMLATCLQRWDDAERHFADALAMNERLGARPYVVRTRRAWAAMLLDRGEPGDAHHAAELIAAGLGEAEGLGMAREVVRFARLSDRVPPIAFEAALHALEGGASSEVQRCELLLALACRLDGAGDHDAARAMFDAAADIARRHPEPVLLARAALGTPTPCADLVEEALAVLGDRNDRLRARLLAALLSATPRAGSDDECSASAIIDTSAASGADTPAAPPASPLHRPLAGAIARLQREGDYWTVAYGDVTSRLHDMKGLTYLSYLLRDPGREFHALDLIRMQTGGSAVDTAVDRGLPALDPQAKTAYRRRLEELRGELAEAEGFNDTGRAERARDEMEAIGEQLAAAVGLGGRDRETSSAAERARTAVTQRVRSAIKRIAQRQPALADHLAARVETGGYCVYRPDPTRPIDWDLG